MHCVRETNFPPAQSWKARLSAYTTLITSFRTSTSESDAVFRPYVSNPSLVKEWVRDANAVSQEKGVEAAAALVEWSGKAAGKTRSEVLPSVVEKCLGSARVSSVRSRREGDAHDVRVMVGWDKGEGYRVVFAVCRGRGGSGRGCHCTSSWSLFVLVR